MTFAPFAAACMLLAAPVVASAQAVRNELAPSMPAPSALITTPVHSIQHRDDGPFYYTGVDFGSMSTLSPASVLLNRGFSVIQLSKRYPRDPRDLTWRTSMNAVFDAIRHPDQAIQRQGGWWEVIRRHSVPWGTPYQATSAAWVPNYLGHVVAGGITTRWMAEYLEAHDAPYPRLTAASMYMATQFVNEVVEQQNETVGNAGTVTDLLFFDPVGVLLFQIDGVARLFSRTIRSADWSNMASFTFPNFEIQNNGQNMAYKFGLPYTDRVEIVWKLGMGSSLGPSVHVGNGNNISPTFGLEASDRRIDPETQVETVRLSLRYGFYWDRFDSLMGSLIYVPIHGKNVVAANLYPGVLPGPLRHVGFWLARTRTGNTIFGIASSRTLGIGVGYQGH